MTFYQLDIKPLTNSVTFCYQEENAARQNKKFPIDKFVEDEPKLLSKSSLDTYERLYLRTKKNIIIAEVISTTDNSVKRVLDLEDINYYINLINRVVLDNEFDYLNDPPSVEDQVEDFIKRFFNDDEEEDLKQKDFLADFFAELESDENSTTNN